MHIYVRECLDQLQRELMDQYKFVFVQLDKILEKEKLQKKIIFDVKTESKQQELLISEMNSFINWDQIAHDVFTESLKKQGMQEQDLTQQQMESHLLKDTFGAFAYYQGLLKMTETEKVAIELAKPFKLYSCNVSLKLHEKLNILERETVRLYQNKLKE